MLCGEHSVSASVTAVEAWLLQSLESRRSPHFLFSGCRCGLSKAGNIMERDCEVHQG